MLKLYKILSLTFISLFIVIPAEAGVIIKSSRISAQVRVRIPRVKSGSHGRKSTSGYARINFAKPTKFNTLKTELSQINAQNRYEKKLYRYNLKLSKKTAALDRKKKKIEAKEARLREKELKKAQRRAERLAKSQSDSEQKATVELASKNNEKGKISSSNLRDKQPVKKSFWAKLWQALIGK